MYLKTTPAHPARAEKRKGRPPAHWACVANRPGGRPPGPVGGPGGLAGTRLLTVAAHATWIGAAPSSVAAPTEDSETLGSSC